jgi:hypothetical protein
MINKDKAKEFLEKLSTPEERMLDLLEKIDREKLRGYDGVNGMDGENGKDGKDGEDGKNGKDGLNGFDGKDGKDGTLITPEEVRDKIKELRDSARLSVFDLKDTEFLKGNKGMMTGWYPALKVITDNTLTGNGTSDSPLHAVGDGIGDMLKATYDPTARNTDIFAYVDTGLATKQNTLISGSNIKTINGASLLGSSNILLQTPLSAGSDYEVPLTFSNGLTRTTNTIKNDLITGKTGGQTAIGGTAVTDILKLQGTSGNGTLTSPAIQLLVGNAGATTALTILNNGNVGIGTTGPTAPLNVVGAAASVPVVQITSSRTGSAGWTMAMAPYVNVSSDSSGTWYTSWGSHYNGATSAWVRDYLGALPSTAFGISTIGDFFIQGDPSVAAGVPTYTRLVTVKNNGNVGIGTIPNANAILDVVSTTKAFIPPRMTTMQKNAIASPTAGMVVFDSSLAKLCVYTTAWETITSV